MSKEKWRIAGGILFAHGQYRFHDEPEWKKIDSIPSFYRQVLEHTAVTIRKQEKFFRIGEQSAIAVSMALELLAHIGQANASFGETAILGYGTEGSHTGNRIYWQDYAENGKVSGKGHLFVGTLSSTPLCQLALILGCHAPVYYASVSQKSFLASELDFLADKCKSAFLVESKPSSCSCTFLCPSSSGLSSQEAVSSLEDAP